MAEQSLHVAGRIAGWVQWQVQRVDAVSAGGFKIDRLRGISREHWSIIDAIRARDSEASVAAGQQHVSRAHESMSQNFV